MLTGKSQRSQQIGFTTIELIVTLIILAIMMATIVPRWFSPSGFEEISYQDEIVTTLRSVQMRSMQQTQNNICHKIKINSDMLGLLATDNANPDNCHLSTMFDSAKYNLATEDGITSVRIDNSHAVTFSGSDFSFNQLGQPVSCGSPCEISIVGGERTVKVIINSEGYIYEG